MLLGDLGDLPPTVVVTAALDPLRDQGRAYAAKAIEAGVDVIYREVPGMIHGFFNYRRVIPSGCSRRFAAVLEVMKCALDSLETSHVEPA